MRAAPERRWRDRWRLRAAFPRRHVLVVPPGPSGGVGDEAVTQCLADCLRDLGARRIGVVAYAPDETWGLPGDEPGLEVVQVPSWPFDRIRWSSPSVRVMLRDYDQVLVAGADCVDGGYSEEGTRALLDLARFADECGCHAAVINCSFNARPTAGSVEAIRSLPERIPFWLRDAVSAESFVRHTGRSVRLGAEVAFLTKRRPVADWAAVALAARGCGARPRIVALVPNPLVGTSEPLRSPQRSPAPYVEVITALARAEGVHFVVLPNDARSAVGDLELTNAIAAALPEDVRTRVTFAPRAPHAGALADLFSHVDLLIGARFHALVIALTAGTPVVGLEYQDKVRGMLRACGLEEFSIPSEAGLAPAEIVARARDALRRADALRATIASHVPYLRRRARSMVVGALVGGG